MDAQDRLSTCGRNSGAIRPDNTASKPFVEAKTSNIRLEDP
jgi:hypothetical protein